MTKSEARGGKGLNKKEREIREKKDRIRRRIPDSQRILAISLR